MTIIGSQNRNRPKLQTNLVDTRNSTQKTTPCSFNLNMSKITAPHLCAKVSALITKAPKSFKWLAIDVLPLAIPPVNPIIYGHGGNTSYSNVGSISFKNPSTLLILVLQGSISSFNFLAVKLNRSALNYLFIKILTYNLTWKCQLRPHLSKVPPKTTLSYSSFSISSYWVVSFVSIELQASFGCINTVLQLGDLLLNDDIT
ncbi:hypothetical protein AGLY_009085 [Aphis glycines]|uniref:Uncharacterized protein n=1 Tax=Aphis glycines TaxID=307491 RepID=A0A6G0TJK4_APHGL|nr:hypothetical protein AGLY_009085 [Aphis glycines]